jgi:hypothetical protein
MQAAYEGHREGGRIAATCEVVFAQAWSPETSRLRRDGEQGIPLDSVRSQLAVRRRP